MTSSVPLPREFRCPVDESCTPPPRYRVENIPRELIALPRWVVFQIVQDVGGKTRKIPRIPGVVPRPGMKHLAESDNPETWRSFDEALADANVRGFHLGFAFGRDLPYFFIDADDVLADDGAVRPDIALLRDSLDTYTEWSARKAGLHIVGRGEFPQHCGKPGVPEGCKPIERFPLHGGRFCIFTGDTIPGLETIEERGAELAALFPPRHRHANGSTASAGYSGPRGELTGDEAGRIVEWAREYWRDGRRHFMALHLSGYLGKQGVAREQAETIIERCAEDDSDPGAKTTACHDTYDALEAGEVVAGWHGLQDACGLTTAELEPLAAILDALWNRNRPKPTATIVRGADADGPKPDIPPFPLHVFPSEIRDFTASAAEAIGGPEEFVAIPELALAEGTIGKTRRIVIRPGFEVSPGGWYGVVAESGTGKSPGLKYAMRLIAPLQDDAWDRYREKLDLWEATPKDERGEKPAPEHYYITDSTGEALWAALTSSPGATQVEDELRRRLKALDAYRQAGDRQTMLAMWSNAPVKIVRKTSAPVYIPFPVAPLVGGIQPGVLRHLSGEGDDADADDGWVPRFLLSWPDAEPLMLSETAFDARTVEPAVAVFRRLRLGQMQTRDSELSKAAYARFREWHAGNRQVQMDSRGLERQWAAKAPLHLARLALVLHALTWPARERPVSDETMRDAIELLEYFRDHLLRVLPAFGANALAGIKTRITRIIATPKTPDDDGHVSRTEIGERLRNVKPDVVTEALEALETAESIERCVEKTATKPRELWRLVTDGSENRRCGNSGLFG